MSVSAVAALKVSLPTHPPVLAGAAENECGAGRQSRVVYCALHMSHTAHKSLAAESVSARSQLATVSHFTVIVSNPRTAAVQSTTEHKVLLGRVAQRVSVPAVLAVAVRSGRVAVC